MKNQIAMHKKLSLGLLVIVLSVLFVLNCHAQEKKEAPIELKFSAYEKAKVSEQEQLSRYKAKQDSLYQKFIFEFISANVQALAIDPKRISLRGDSVQIGPNGILLKLKTKK